MQTPISQQNLASYCADALVFAKVSEHGGQASRLQQRIIIQEAKKFAPRKLCALPTGISETLSSRRLQANNLNAVQMFQHLSGTVSGMVIDQYQFVGDIGVAQDRLDAQ